MEVLWMQKTYCRMLTIQKWWNIIWTHVQWMN